ncbi:HNH endonuclease [Ferrimicrobium acidiphilum]|uniref:HNH endonuclease n=2 Tax=Ferrimicrobium acidiphilum TaxID=121039 RepID=UPI0023F1E986|nr:HNH endonuclease [Ferrimicrobium acidiphilum]
MDSIPISLLCRDCGDLGFKWGIYLPIYPVYVEAEDRSRHEFAIAVDENLHGLDLGSIDDFRREYRVSVTKIRLHQPSFRSRVLHAYNSTCAICRLHHPELLDAAHILPDVHPRGAPVVPNGITLCKLHHAASFDRNLLGIRPDFVVEIRSELLREIDGPMLQHDIKEMNGTQLELPGERASRPDTARLEERYQELIEVARPRPYRQGLRSRLVNDNTTDALGPACSMG